MTASDHMREPVEPGRGLRFRNPRQRERHFVKHVLLGRNERWHQVLGNEEVARARDEWSQGSCLGETGMRLARDYESHLDRLVTEASEKGLWHAHWARVELDDRFEPVRTIEVLVDVWPPHEKVFVAAGAFVRKSGKTAPYVLKTGFRAPPRMSSRAFARRRRERFRAKLMLSSRRLIAFHDEEEPRR